MARVLVAPSQSPRFLWLPTIATFPPKPMFLTAAKLIGAGLATISLAGAGVGIGSVFGAFQVALARNPGLVAVLFRYAILGFALTEAIALFGLMMAFLILFAF
jgi:F0F1-type ATP synthase membrane subunit c/vacuolar-type H+-ATPase subunit K